jgi:hypothetical protein
LAKAAGVNAQLCAFDAPALALTVLTVPFVAILATAASVYGGLTAFDAKGPALPLTVTHVAF